MKKNLLLLPAVLCSLSGLLSSQTKFFYIPDGNAASGTPNVIPFGSGSASWANQRCQFLLKKKFLPSKPGLLRSIGFAPAGSGTYKFRALVFRLGPNTSGILGPTFSASFSGVPSTIFNEAAFSWKVTANRWNRLPLSRPFVYNGKDNLFLDVLALGSDLNRNAGFRRATEPRYFKIGVTTGAADALYGKGCPGSNKQNPVFHPYSYPLLGADFFRIGLDQALPHAPSVLFLGNRSTKFAGLPLPFSLAFMGAPGCFLNTSIVFMNALAAGPLGTAHVDMPIPNSPALEGLSLFMQWAVLDKGANPAGLVTSRGLKATVGSVAPPSGSGPGAAALKVELGFL